MGKKFGPRAQGAALALLGAVAVGGAAAGAIGADSASSLPDLNGTSLTVL
jgi:hypothetical protein